MKNYPGEKILKKTYVKNAADFLALIVQVIREDAARPDFARAVLDKYRPGLTFHDLARLVALDFRRRLLYTREKPNEEIIHRAPGMFAAPVIRGDCDDATIYAGAVMSILARVYFPGQWTLKAVLVSHMRRRDYHHVYLEAQPVGKPGPGIIMDLIRRKHRRMPVFKRLEIIL
jgi:hypothetical protein